MDAAHSNAWDLILRGLLELLNAQREELRAEFWAELDKLKTRLPRWVTDEQAQQITGLARDTLRRHRQASGSLIIYQANPLRYDYDSLLRHNDQRALGRGRLSKL